MPTYDYQCHQCHHEFEAYNYLDDRRFQQCENCGGACEIIFKSVAAAHTFEPYFDVALGRRIESAKDKRRVLKEMGLTNVGDADFDQVERVAKENKALRDRQYLDEKPSKEFLESYNKAQVRYPNK